MLCAVVSCVGVPVCIFILYLRQRRSFLGSVSKTMVPPLSVSQNAEPLDAHQKMEIFLNNSAWCRHVMDRWTFMEFSFAAE